MIHSTPRTILMPSPTQQSQALLRIVSLVLAVFLFIAMTEQDARHDTHQRWLAEARRRQETGMLADSTHAHRPAVGNGRTHGGRRDWERIQTAQSFGVRSTDADWR